MGNLDNVARANKMYFSSDRGKKWVDNERKYQGEAVNKIMAKSIIKFFGDMKEVKILSPSANIATVESDMLEVF